MTDVRRCWAFHPDGARCEHPAGHPGNHVVSKEWTDDECATPEKPVQKLVQVPLVPEPPAAAPAAPVKCVACQHHHKGGACKCGCHEFIG